MVSLIERNTYFNQLRENRKFDLFFSYIFSLPIKFDDQKGNDIDSLFSEMVLSLRDLNRNRFQLVLDKISARDPKSTTPFVNDDFLIFIVILGVKKFELDQSWLNRVLEVRGKVTKENGRIVTTYRNILNSGYNSSENLVEIVLFFEEILGEELIKKGLKKSWFKSIVSRDFPHYKSDFLNVLDLRANYLVLEHATSLLDEGELFQLKKFEAGFLKRVDTITNISFFLLLAGVLFLIIWLVFSPKFDSIIGKVDILLGILGVGIFGFINKLKKWWTSVFSQTLHRFWKYEKRDT